MLLLTNLFVLQLGINLGVGVVVDVVVDVAVVIFVDEFVCVAVKSVGQFFLPFQIKNLERKK
jgi:hypothetical protein